MAKKLEELAVYQNALELGVAVTALLERVSFRKDRKLRDQIARAVDSIAANVSEGFEQSTDRAFARYLYIAKGSTAEVCTRLRQAERKRYVSATELARCLVSGDRLARMIASLIRYLERSDFKDRGRFKLRHPMPNQETDQEIRGGQQAGDPEQTESRPELRDLDLRNQESEGVGTEGLGTKDGGQGTRDKGPRTRDPGLRDPGTEGPGTEGPGTGGPRD